MKNVIFKRSTYWYNHKSKTLKTLDFHVNDLIPEKVRNSYLTLKVRFKLVRTLICSS